MELGLHSFVLFWVAVAGQIFVTGWYSTRLVSGGVSNQPIQLVFLAAVSHAFLYVMFGALSGLWSPRTFILLISISLVSICAVYLLRVLTGQTGATHAARYALLNQSARAGLITLGSLILMAVLSLIALPMFAWSLYQATQVASEHIAVSGTPQTAQNIAAWLIAVPAVLNMFLTSQVQIQQLTAENVVPSVRRLHLAETLRSLLTAYFMVQAPEILFVGSDVNISPFGWSWNIFSSFPFLLFGGLALLAFFVGGNRYRHYLGELEDRRAALFQALSRASASGSKDELDACFEKAYRLVAFAIDGVQVYQLYLRRILRADIVEPSLSNFAAACDSRSAREALTFMARSDLRGVQSSAAERAALERKRRLLALSFGPEAPLVLGQQRVMISRWLEIIEDNRDVVRHWDPSCGVVSEVCEVFASDPKATSPTSEYALGLGNKPLWRDKAARASWLEALGLMGGTAASQFSGLAISMQPYLAFFAL